MKIVPVLPALSDHLDRTAKAAEEIVQAAVVPFCSVYHGNLKYIELAHSMAIGEDIGRTVQFVACALPYKKLYEKEKGNADHGHLSEEYMDKFVACMTSVMKKGA